MKPKVSIVLRIWETICILMVGIQWESNSTGDKKVNQIICIHLNSSLIEIFQFCYGKITTNKRKKGF